MMDTGAPLIRIFALSHFLPLKELGFATLLTAYVSVLALSTDISIHRFIYSAPRDQFDKAIAAAHALAVARGAVLGFLAFSLAPIIAATLSLGADWSSFALLAPTMILISFEHLGPKIAERDFQYGAQIKTNFVGYAVGLTILIAVSIETHSHIAVVASAYGQAIAIAIASRIYAGTPYRLDFFSPLFKQAFKYAYPLVFNGMGLAIASQADRFLVAGLFNLQAVAIYSIIVTTASYPAQVLTRFFSTTLLARFYHASVNTNRLQNELRFASNVSAMIGAFYAGGVIFLTDFVATTVFGPRFQASSAAMMFLGLAAYIRFIRNEPFNALMLNVGKTKRLAASNLLVSTTLVYMLLVSFFDRSMEAVLMTRALGEATALIFTIQMARQVRDSGRLVFSRADIVGAAFVGLACAGSAVLGSFGRPLLPTLAVCVLYTIGIALWAAVGLRGTRVSIPQGPPQP